VPFPNPSTQFTKGQSGNPGGRPKTAKLRDELSRLIDEKQLGPKLMQKLAVMALSGDIRAMAMILDRIDGKVPDRIEVGSDEDDPPATDETGQALEP
jgi:hypothetical protein